MFAQQALLDLCSSRSISQPRVTRGWSLQNIHHATPEVSGGLKPPRTQIRLSITGWQTVCIFTFIEMTWIWGECLVDSPRQAMLRWGRTRNGYLVPHIVWQTIHGTGTWPCTSKKWSLLLNFGSTMPTICKLKNAGTRLHTGGLRPVNPSLQLLVFSVAWKTTISTWNWQSETLEKRHGYGPSCSRLPRFWRDGNLWGKLWVYFECDHGRGLEYQPSNGIMQVKEHLIEVHGNDWCLVWIIRVLSSTGRLKSKVVILSTSYNALHNTVIGERLDWLLVESQRHMW